MAESAPKFPEGQRIELAAQRSAIRWLRVWVVSLTLVAALGTLATGFQFFQQRSFSAETRKALVRTQAALCSFRGDLQDRVKNSKDFLATHPHGLPGLATAKQIRDDIANRERTIRSLRRLSCPPRLPVSPPAVTP